MTRWSTTGSLLAAALSGCWTACAVAQAPGFNIWQQPALTVLGTPATAAEAAAAGATAAGEGVALTDFRLSMGDEGPLAEAIDLDHYLAQCGAPPSGAAAPPAPTGAVLLPQGLIYAPYLAGVKQSRSGVEYKWDTDDGWLLDSTLGGQVGLLRWGAWDPVSPNAVQLDFEGSAQIRLDPEQDLDFRSVDFRAGVPLSIANGRHRTKIGYYHISSHLGDEFLLKNPGFPRLNYVRDAISLGHSVYLAEPLRVYAEASWAFYSEVSEPWHFQFGAEYAPARGNGRFGAPFLAVNGHLREEVNFSGALSANWGWAWRGHENGRLLRLGGYYYNGKSSQYSFFNNFEHQIGVGLWIDN